MAPQGSRVTVSFILFYKIWQAAARIYYDLRCRGLTVRSPVDCCIAQVALENDLLLIHDDRDFESIAQVRSLQNLRFQPEISDRT